MTYKQDIHDLIERAPLDIDMNAEFRPRKPTMANSMFHTNKEQGDWAEKIVLNSINENSNDFVAVKYGRDDSLAADDPSFDDYFTTYVSELNLK